MKKSTLFGFGGVHRKTLRHGISALPLLFLFSVLMPGCREEQDSLPPYVEFLTPAENAVFSITDTIRIEATVRSDLPLLQLSLTLLNQQGNPVQPALDVLPFLRATALRCDLVITDTSLPGGTYSLMLTAEHGQDNKRKFRVIQIESIPRTWQGFLALTRQSFDRTTLQLVMPDLQVSALDTFSGDHLTSVMLYPSRVLVVAGRVSAGLTAYDVAARQVKWSIPAMPNPPFPYITALDKSGDLALIGLFEGRIRVVRANGMEQTGIPLAQSRIPHKSLLINDKLMVDEQSSSGYERHMGVYYYPSGMMYQGNIPGMETIGFFPLSGQEVAWVGNQGGQGVIRIYDIPAGTAWSSLGWTAGRIKAACAGLPGQLLVSTTSGIYWYRRDLNSFVPFRADLSPQWLAFEDLNRRVVTASGTGMHLLSFPEAQVLAYIALNDSIYEVHPLYNR